MKITVSVSPDEVTLHEGAILRLYTSAGALSDIYLDFSALLRSVPIPTESALDLLLLASTVYAADKLLRRADAADKWTRTIELSVPIDQPRLWSSNVSVLEECLGFLSGDEWKVRFTKRRHSIIRKKERKRHSSKPPQYAMGKVACLFSGGLDSLVGAVDWMEDNPGDCIALVGHHDLPGALSDQTSLIASLDGAYPGRFTKTLVGVGQTGRGGEITMRSRSFLFIALGVVVAEHLGKDTPLLIPENGTIALNVPLTPSRRGSCSTRTAHPHYLALLEQWLLAIGLNHPLQNPLIGKTKGEVVSSCRNPDLLASIYSMSVSCAKRGRRNTWVRRDAKSCGRCMPCIYRRAALHQSGLDRETYGSDFCRGEVDWTNGKSEAADDLRACLSFLVRDHSNFDIAKMLVASGYLPALDALEHAATVERAMDEIRVLLAKKGMAAIKAAAGLGGRNRYAH